MDEDDGDEVHLRLRTAFSTGGPGRAGRDRSQVPCRQLAAVVGKMCTR